MVLVNFKIHSQERTRADIIIQSLKVPRSQQGPMIPRSQGPISQGPKLLNHSIPLKTPQFEPDSEAALTRRNFQT